MPSVSSIGMGSGLDLSNIANDLIDLEEKTHTDLIDKKEAALLAKLSGLGIFKSSLNDFKGSLQLIKSNLQSYNAKVSGSNGVEVVADINASDNLFDLQVESLAKTQKTQLMAIDNANNTFSGSGTLQIIINNQTKNFDVSATDNLYDLKNKINSSNCGVVSQIIKYNNGYVFSIQSSNSGEDQRFEVSGSGVLENIVPSTVAVDLFEDQIYDNLDITLSDGQTTTIDVGVGCSVEDLVDLINSDTTLENISAKVVSNSDGSKKLIVQNIAEYSGQQKFTLNSNAVNLQQTSSSIAPESSSLRRAQDGAIYIDGGLVYLQSNFINNVIPGVSIAITDDAIGTISTIEISKRVDNFSNELRSFVDAFNLMYTTLDDLSSGSKEPKGLLANDTTIPQLQNKMKTKLLREFGANNTTLSSLGISSDRYTGNLMIDEFIFSSKSNMYAVDGIEFLISDNGLIADLSEIVDEYVTISGYINSKENLIDKQLNGLLDDREKLSFRINQLSSRLKSQFIAMDQVVGKLKSTGNMLEQAFETTVKPLSYKK